MTIPDNREGLTGQTIEHQGQNPTGNTDARLGQAIQAGWQRALHTDQYEIASQAFGEVTALRNWRSRASRSFFSPFYNLAETATELNQVGASDEVREEVADRLTPMAQSLSPRVRDLYMGLVSRIDGRPYTPQYPMTEEQLANLTDSGDLALLEDPSVPWNLKINRMETRVESELRGRKALDRRDKEVKDEKPEGTNAQPQSTPPPDRDQSKPGMDEMERLKEGEEAPAIWSIQPAYGGYYKEQSFNVWDSQTNTWRREDLQSPYHVDLAKNREGKDLGLTITANIPAGQPTRVPTPYHFVIGNIEARGLTTSIEKDKNGDSIIKVHRIGGLKQAIPTTIQMFRKDDATVSDNPPSNSLNFPANLSEATETEVTKIGEAAKTNIQKARSLASFTMRHLIYSNDSSYNVLYEGHQDGYIGAIDQFKKADCDVANTYFAALCSKLGIPVRHVVGHMVKGKDSEGNARITSGTGHAWTEVWDDKNRSWVRIDATPPGDPQMEDQQKGNGIPGDYGGEEAIGPTDEELTALHEKLSSLTEALSYTQEERELSEATGVELKDARKIIKEIQEAENTKLPNGEKVVDVMSQLWSLIAQSRTIAKQEYTGPLRKREGGEEIDDIIAHKIGVKAGETDPASRQKEHVEVQTERIIRKLQTRIVGDKSGSMSQTVDGETKWELQRRAMYLVLSSLDRAQRNLQRESSRLIEPLSIETQVISFRDASTIDIDKPLSTGFSLEDKVRLWHSLGDQGVGNGDVAALSQLYEEISEEVEGQQGQEDDALRIIIACSDGEPDDPARVHQLAQALGELNTLVIGVGLTETAEKVPIIFDTPFSRGDLARDINDLPAILAKHVVTEAIKLFPKDSLQGYQRAIDNILAKFDRVGVV